MPEVRRSSTATRAQSDPAIANGAPSPTEAPGVPPVPTPLQTTQSPSTDDAGAAAATTPQSPLGRVSSLLMRGQSNDDTNTSVDGKKTKKKTSFSVPTDGAPAAPTSSNQNERPSTAEAAGRQSMSYALRPQADVYYDSRAGTRKEWRRRARTLEEYYEDNPDLLPQLPFTWHHGKRRWRLWLFAFIVFVDASAIPIALYFGMKYSGHVKEYIIFAIITSIWGGPTYLEFAIRTLRLIKKEHFYRPLGTTSRWATDMTTWASSLAIFVLTALFIIGSAPHDAWNRVVAMAAPSLLWTLGGVLLAITLLHRFNIPAPFRISSTGKGEKVHPGAYYFIEDIMAVNARCGRPYREALAARYRASPRFREMMYEQSMFWSIPALVLAAMLTVVAVVPQVPEDWGYGLCWTVPFVWAFVWGCITIRWCKKCMVRERLEWEAGTVPAKSVSPAIPPEADAATPADATSAV